jgi:hypothetical protein
MGHWWIVWQMSKLKQRELLREAARFRVLQNDSKRENPSRRDAHHFDTPLTPFLASLRYSLGQRLIDWGTFLKKHQALSFKHR